MPPTTRFSTLHVRCWPIAPAALLAVALAALLAALLASPAYAKESPAAGAAPAAPCLPGDPYLLADLNAAISADNPPTGTVSLNRFISITYIGKGTLVAQTEDSEAIDPYFQPPTIPGQPEPDERDEATVPAVDTRVPRFQHAHRPRV